MTMAIVIMIVIELEMMMMSSRYTAIPLIVKLKMNVVQLSMIRRLGLKNLNTAS